LIHEQTPVLVSTGSSLTGDGHHEIIALIAEEYLDPRHERKVEPFG
jgi:hypothetical protein